MFGRRKEDRSPEQVVPEATPVLAPSLVETPSFASRIDFRSAAYAFRTFSTRDIYASSHAPRQATPRPLHEALAQAEPLLQFADWKAAEAAGLENPACEVTEEELGWLVSEKGQDAVASMDYRERFFASRETEKYRENRQRVLARRLRKVPSYSQDYREKKYSLKTLWDAPSVDYVLGLCAAVFEDSLKYLNSSKVTATQKTYDEGTREFLTASLQSVGLVLAELDEDRKSLAEITESLAGLRAANLESEKFLMTELEANALELQTSISAKEAGVAAAVASCRACALEVSERAVESMSRQRVAAVYETGHRVLESTDAPSEPSALASLLALNENAPHKISTNRLKSAPVQSEDWTI